MWGKDEKCKFGSRVTETRTHPRILRLYHKMAPTTSSASSSNRNTGMTMEAEPASEKKTWAKKHEVYVLQTRLSELCDLLPLEVEESTEATAISHLYPLHPTGHLGTRWDRVAKFVWSFQIPICYFCSDKQERSLSLEICWWLDSAPHGTDLILQLPAVLYQSGLTKQNQIPSFRFCFHFILNNFY